MKGQCTVATLIFLKQDNMVVRRHGLHAGTSISTPNVFACSYKIFPAVFIDQDITGALYG